MASGLHHFHVPQAESLLREFQARVTMRTTTPRKASKKKFDFSARKSPDSGKSLVKSTSDDQDQPPKPKSDDQQLHTPSPGTCKRQSTVIITLKTLGPKGS